MKFVSLIATAGILLKGTTAATGTLTENQDQILTPEDLTSNSEFGYEMSSSGNLLAVGAHRMDTYKGAAYIYQTSESGSWAEAAKIQAPDGEAQDFFGNSISLHKETLAIGAPGDDDDGDLAGAVYLYEMGSSCSNWNQVTKLTSGVAGEFFGTSVSLKNDILVIGATRGSGESGKAYIFEKVDGTWTQAAELEASDGSGKNWFGFDVSQNNQGTVFVSAYGADALKGAVYIFQKDKTNFWNEIAKVTASDGPGYDLFGRSIAVDGSRLVVGSQNRESRTGAAYVFNFNGTTWNEEAILTASDASTSKSFGYSVDIVLGKILVGSIYDDSNGENSGSAYVFSLENDSAWTESFKLVSLNEIPGALLGSSVAINKNGAFIVGAAYADSNAGQVLVFN